MSKYCTNIHIWKKFFCFRDPIRDFKKMSAVFWAKKRLKITPKHTIEIDIGCILLLLAEICTFLQ
jgi:hypothetical protein